MAALALFCAIVMVIGVGLGYQAGHDDGYSQGASAVWTRWQASQSAPRIEFAPSGDTGIVEPFDTKVTCLRNGRAVPCTQAFVREMMAAETPNR
jgi:hypothetical protein